MQNIGIQQERSSDIQCAHHNSHDPNSPLGWWDEDGEELSIDQYNAVSRRVVNNPSAVTPDSRLLSHVGSGALVGRLVEASSSLSTCLVTSRRSTCMAATKRDPLDSPVPMNSLAAQYEECEVPTHRMMETPAHTATPCSSSWLSTSRWVLPMIQSAEKQEGVPPPPPRRTDRRLPPPPPQRKVEETHSTASTCTSSCSASSGISSMRLNMFDDFALDCKRLKTSAIGTVQQNTFDDFLLDSRRMSTMSRLPGNAPNPGMLPCDNGNGPIA